jgi:hypothetical protein
MRGNFSYFVSGEYEKGLPLANTPQMFISTLTVPNFSVLHPCKIPFRGAICAAKHL